MKKSMLWLLCCAMTPVVAASEPAEEKKDSEAVTILKKVDAAAKAIKSVKYDITFEGTGAARERAGSMKASVKAEGRTDSGPQKYRIVAEIKRPGSEEAVRVEAGTDGKDYFLINHNKKMVHVDIDPAVIGSMGQRLMGGLMQEFMHPTPFTDEINAKSQELKGEKSIEGEDCYEIQVAYGQFNLEATWWFSKKDHLPRARNDVFKTPDGAEGGQVKTVTNLVVDPKFTDDDFKVTVPEGYTKTDEFAD